MTDGEEKQEIIIVRRVMGGDDGHHGGAWKIAFADFMTAMMALFLVLWLVNAANEKTKKSVASYFNPVKLIDRTRSTKGLDEVTSKDLPKSTEEGEKAGETKFTEEKTSPEIVIKDESFFKDPFALLDGIASQELERIENAQLVLNKEHVSNAPEEDAFLDPFSQAIEQPKGRGETPREASEPSMPLDMAGVASLEALSKTVERIEPHTKTTTREEPEETVSSNPHMKPRSEDTPKEKVVPELRPQAKPERYKQIEKMSAEILEEIKTRLTNKLGEQEKLSESLTVRVTNEGILISITDQFGFSMFQVGSAVPKGEIILAMSEISGVLSKRKGKVRIFGHTDARPYAGEDYDNWRLSTSRAHSARLMLVRGGLQQSRVSRVVGFADRILRVPEAPESDANRRIEILLEMT